MGTALLAGLLLATWSLAPSSNSASANQLAGITAVAAGGNHTCALTDAGGALCWGDNHYGQLGDGTAVGRGKPVPVTGLSSGVSAIAVGDNHTCALLSMGAVKCWGYNRYGQLGNPANLRNSIAANPLPLDVTGLQSGVTAITAGGAHTCALLDTSGVRCWGWDRRGQLGDGPGCPDFTCAAPRDVSGLTSSVAAIDAGVYHTCAVLASGGVKCWGQNVFGELGATTGSPCVTETLDPTPCAPEPIDVPGLSGVSAVAAGGENAGAHTCALLSTGGVTCWGANAAGQLGDGQACGLACQSPVGVSGLDSGAVAIEAAGRESCALLDDAAAYCWGANGAGQLGNGDRPNDSTVPVAVCPDASCPLACLLPCDTVLSNVVDIALGVTHACAALSSGAMKCWGGDSLGQLGDSLACGESCDTPVDVLLPKASLPDLVVEAMRIELQTGGSCAFTISLGITVEFRNIGTGDAAPFVVEVNGAQQTAAGGLGAGSFSALWFQGYPGAQQTSTAVIDATSLVTESDETNNTLTKSPPVPTLPATCTPTPARTPAATPTPAAARGDASCDGRVNSIDAALVLQRVAGLLGSLPCPEGGDANHDGRTNSIDAALILQYVAGLLDGL